MTEHKESKILPRLLKAQAKLFMAEANYPLKRGKMSKVEWSKCLNSHRNVEKAQLHLAIAISLII